MEGRNDRGTYVWGECPTSVALAVVGHKTGTAAAYRPCHKTKLTCTRPARLFCFTPNSWLLRAWVLLTAVVHCPRNKQFSAAVDFFSRCWAYSNCAAFGYLSHLLIAGLECVRCIDECAAWGHAVLAISTQHCVQSVNLFGQLCNSIKWIVTKQCKAQWRATRKANRSSELVAQLKYEN